MPCPLGGQSRAYYPSMMPAEESFLAPPADSLRDGARVVVIPFGLEKTTSYGKGTRNGPAAIIRASHDVEYLDEETGEEPYRKGIITLEEPVVLIAAMGHEEAIEYLYALVSGVATGEYPGVDALKKSAFPLILGGEHSLTVGAVKALHDLHGPIHILHFDAHSDFRPAYGGSKFSHACAMTLCLPYAAQIVSVGIRSHAKEAREVVERHHEKIRIFWERRDIRRRGSVGIPWVAESLIELLQGKKVYLTFDVDVLDGATIGSSTGTPEPGGLSYNEVLDIWYRVLPHVELVGADFVELSPIAGQHAPDFAVARLVYKLIGYVK